MRHLNYLSVVIRPKFIGIHA